MKRISKYILFVLMILSGFSGICSGGLTERINSIVSRKSQKKVDFAVKVIEAGSGKTIYSRKAVKPMIPASNMKVIISAAAIDYLGADYKFITKVGLMGDTLVIIGGGDPLFGDNQTDSKYGRKKDWVIEQIIYALKAEGVTKIKDIIVDSSFFDDNRVHPSWPREQLNLKHACEVSGLNYNGNCVRIIAKNSGGRAVVTTDPKTKYLNITNKVKTVSKGSSAIGAYRHKTPNKITVKGKCRKSAGFDTTIERPAAFLGFVLAERLPEAGIKVEGELIEKYVKRDTRIKIIKTFETKMADVLDRCNKDSHGLAAECLLKTISAEKNTPRWINGEWRHGFVLVSRYLDKYGIDDKQYVLDDARGLSRNNKLSPNTITTVISRVYNSKNKDAYFDSLAVGGVDGTIRRYFGNQKYKGKIIGKTGYINKVKTFSGMCKTARGDYIFSILTDNANGNTRTAINDIAQAIIDNAN